MAQQNQAPKQDEEKSVMQLLLEMKQENQVIAQNQQTEILGLKNVIMAQENSLAAKINENNENLKKMLAENSTYFQGEINKINTRFEENERRTEVLIKKALKAERERQEKLARDKTNVPVNESNLAGAMSQTPHLGPYLHPRDKPFPFLQGWKTADPVR